MRRRLMGKRSGDDMSRSYFYIEYIGDYETQVSFSGSTSLLYSMDECKTWETFDVQYLAPGDKIYFKGNVEAGIDESIGYFSIADTCNVGGNIMSLLFGDDFIGQEDLTGYSYVFAFLFESNYIFSAENLVLPATTLAEGCYSYMFSNCPSLTIAPELPATILANDCYYNMFGYCSSLTTAPALPATTLAEYCYRYMFQDCTALTTAPSILPATTLEDYCYNAMFGGCTSLTTAPELPATTLVYNCYRFMFRGCTNLNYIKMLATDISAQNCLYYWVNNVASSGTFVKNKDATWTITGNSGVPSSWTIEYE